MSPSPQFFNSNVTFRPHPILLLKSCPEILKISLSLDEKRKTKEKKNTISKRMKKNKATIIKYIMNNPQNLANGKLTQCILFCPM